MMELCLIHGAEGVIQANTCEERRNLSGARDWRVKFMGGGLT